MKIISMEYSEEQNKLIKGAKESLDHYNKILLKNLKDKYSVEIITSRITEMEKLDKVKKEFLDDPIRKQMIDHICRLGGSMIPTITVHKDKPSNHEG